MSKIVNGFLALVTIGSLLVLAVLCTTQDVKFDGQIMLIALAVITVPAYLATLPIKSETKS